MWLKYVYAFFWTNGHMMDFDEWCICNFLIVSIYDKWWMLVNNLFTLIIYIGWIYDKWWMLVEYVIVDENDMIHVGWIWFICIDHLYWLDIW